MDVVIVSVDLRPASGGSPYVINLECSVGIRLVDKSNPSGKHFCMKVRSSYS